MAKKTIESELPAEVPTEAEAQTEQLSTSSEQRFEHVDPVRAGALDSIRRQTGGSLPQRK